MRSNRTKIPNDPRWDKMRPLYLKLGEAKRAHKRAISAFNSAEPQLMAAAKASIKTTLSNTAGKVVEAILDPLFNNQELSEVPIDEHVIDVYPERLLKAKNKYRAAIQQLHETQIAIEEAEKEYGQGLAQLLHAEGFSIRKIAHTLGMHPPTLLAQVYKNRNIETEED